MILLSSLVVQGVVHNRVIAFSSVLTLCSCCFTTWNIIARTLLCFTPKLREFAIRKLISSYVIIQLFTLCTMNGVKLVITGDQLPEEAERVLYICNHQSWTDWLLIEMSGVRANASGLINYIIKDSIKYIPYYGLQLYLNGCLYIKRDRMKDRALMASLTHWLLRKYSNYWIVLFPEGTRLAREKTQLIEKSHEIAIQRGYAPFENVLFPKPGGFQILTQNLSQYLDAIYDVTIAYPKGDTIPPHFMDFSRGNIPEVHMHINRIPFAEMANLLTDEETANTWLCDTFKAKDDRLKEFYRTGQLSDGPADHYRLGYRRTFPIVCFYLSFCLPLILTSRGREIWWKLSLVYALGGTFVSSIFL